MINSHNDNRLFRVKSASIFRYCQAPFVHNEKTDHNSVNLMHYSYMFTKNFNFLQTIKGVTIKLTISEKRSFSLTATILVF